MLDKKIDEVRGHLEIRKHLVLSDLNIYEGSQYNTLKIRADLCRSFLEMLEQLSRCQLHGKVYSAKSCPKAPASVEPL